jgi:formate hydrogenlyase transcriptional activator
MGEEARCLKGRALHRCAVLAQRLDYGEQEFERLGSAQTIKTDVRLVAATNRDLVQMVGEQTFRDDLYYRLNVFPITVPPLRERTAHLLHHSKDSFVLS